MRLLILIFFIQNIAFSEFAYSKGAVGSDLLYTNTPAGGGVVCSSAFDPTTVTDLIFWQRAKEDIYSDSSGLVPAVNGDPVYIWDSPNGSPQFSQPTLSQRPIYDSDGLNGNPTLFFDGVDDYVRVVGSPPDPTQPFVVFFVIEVITPLANETLLAGGVFCRLFLSATNRVRAACSTSLTSSATFTSDPTILAVVFDGATSRIYFNGGIAVASGAIGTDVFDTAVMILGGQYPNTSSGDKMNVNISEFMFYEQLLSDADINLVGNYLADEYCLTWTDI